MKNFRNAASLNSLFTTTFALTKAVATGYIDREPIGTGITCVMASMVGASSITEAKGAFSTWGHFLALIDI